jgi:hypothetical protein
MRVANLEYLQSFDSPNEWETPTDFDYLKELYEVRNLGPTLSQICGYPLRLDDQVQDASYFTEWFALEPEPRPMPNSSAMSWIRIIGIRFSAFGRMYTISFGSDLYPVSEATRERVIDFLAASSYVYVPDSILALPGRSFDWQIRFFDYL